MKRKGEIVRPHIYSTEGLMYHIEDTKWSFAQVWYDDSYCMHIGTTRKDTKIDPILPKYLTDIFVEGSRDAEL